MTLAGQHALITGGGTGIGAAIARALAETGARISIVGRRLDPVRETAATLNLAGRGEVFFGTCDVTDRVEVGKTFEAARHQNGPISILVNNAGAAQSAPFAKVTAQGWRETMAVNLDALLHCCQEVLPGMLQADYGRIVTIASTAGLKGYPYSAPYVAAKHGAIGLMRALAAEHAGAAVTFNSVCPGFTDTEIVASAVSTITRKTGRSESQARADLARFNPQGRLIEPAEVAGAVLWLCMPESRSITGQAIAVAGGEVT